MTSIASAMLEGGAQGDHRTNPARDALAEATAACGERFTACLTTYADRRKLHAAVREYALRVRAQQVPPERAVAAFKAMLSSLPAVTRRGPNERGAIVAEWTRMAIEEYYAE